MEALGSFIKFALWALPVLSVIVLTLAGLLIWKW